MNVDRNSQFVCGIHIDGNEMKWSTLYVPLCIFNSEAFARRFSWDIGYEGGLKKLEPLRYPSAKSGGFCKHLSSHGTSLWQTDGWTDRQTGSAASGLGFFRQKAVSARYEVQTGSNRLTVVKTKMLVSWDGTNNNIHRSSCLLLENVQMCLISIISCHFQPKSYIC